MTSHLIEFYRGMNWCLSLMYLGIMVLIAFLTQSITVSVEDTVVLFHKECPIIEIKNDDAKVSCTSDSGAVMGRWIDLRKIKTEKDVSIDPSKIMKLVGDCTLYQGVMTKDENLNCKLLYKAAN